MTVRIRWLGQAGFAIYSSAGELCLVDAYLSDYLRTEMHLPRVAPIVLDPGAIQPLVSAASHWHPDHLDPTTSRVLAASSPGTVFVGPPANAGRLALWGVPADRIVTVERGQSATVGPFGINAFFARHDVPGWICEDAVTYVISVEGVRIFHTGDTEYDARIRAVKALGDIDVGLFAMNGTGGNMNAREAALLAIQLAPSIAVPMHYGMWAPDGYGGSWASDVFRSTLDPDSFRDAYRALGGSECRILQLGEELMIESRSRAA